MLHTHDWFTNHIDAQQDTLVADSDWLQKIYGAEHATGAQFSLRLISDLEQGWHLPVLIVRHDNPFILDELNVHDQMHDLRNRILVSISARIPTIVVPATECKLADAQFGIYCGHHGTIVKDAAGLARFLGHFNEGMLENAGAWKPIFHDIRDAFQSFTRTFLNGHLVIQDFDMLRKTEGQWQAIETKRHKCAVQYWRPYTNDSKNFTALAAGSAALGMAKPLCVSYRVDEPAASPLISVNLIQNATYEAITGQRCVVAYKDVWQANPTEEFYSTKRMEPRKAA